MIHRAFFLSDSVVQALGWTLIHSLWQGAAAALILWLILPRLGSAQQRYWAAYAALMALFTGALSSFVLLYDPPAVGAVTPGNGNLVVVHGVTGTATAGLNLPATFWQNASAWLETWYPAIVSLWLAGFVFFLFRLAGGLYYVRRLRAQKNQAAASVWQEKVQSLANRLRLSRPVQVFESALIQTPMAIGFLKPLILLPIGLINQISAAEVEAILAHELAHISRRDWLFNLLQALVEALFYFHPAVWWISSAIRAERENCCDDTAIALTGNRLVYAKTLVRLQDLAKQTRVPALALGIEGSPTLLRRRPLLLERIKRILHQPQQSTSLMEKMIATGILVALITLFSVRANTPPALVKAIREFAGKPVAWLSGVPPFQRDFQAATDTIKPQHRQKIVQDDGEKKVEMDLEDGRITRLNVDGKDIPESEFPQYESLTRDILENATPPVPPMAPMPPMGLGAMPTPAPGMPTSPMPPPTPIPGFGRPSLISTDKDQEGNTIIRLERNGKPIEIVVKDGQVWVDGKEVEEGEDLEIPDGNNFFFYDDDNGHAFQLDGKQFFFPEGDSSFMKLNMPDMNFSPQLFRLDDNHFKFKGLDGQVIEIPYPKFSPEQLEKLSAESMQHLKQQQLEWEKSWKEREKEWEKAQKGWGNLQKDQRKALKEAYRAMEQARIEQQEELLGTQRAYSRARDEQQAARNLNYIKRRNAESGSGVLKNSMIEDKLITDPNNYSFELSGKELQVNGQKQPDAVHKKYLELYQQATGKELGKKDKVRMEEEN